MRQVLSYTVRDRARRRLVRPVRQLNRKQVVRPPMSPETRRRLQTEFAPDVAYTSELLGRDLATLWFGARSAPVAKREAEPALAR